MALHAESDLLKLQRKEIIGIFKRADTDASGEIDASELHNLMESVIGRPPTPAEVYHVGTHIDKNGDHKIQENEFVDALIQWLAEVESTRLKRERGKLYLKHLRLQIYLL